MSDTNHDFPMGPQLQPATPQESASQLYDWDTQVMPAILAAFSSNKDLPTMLAAIQDPLLRLLQGLQEELYSLQPGSSDRFCDRLCLIQQLWDLRSRTPSMSSPSTFLVQSILQSFDAASPQSNPSSSSPSSRPEWFNYYISQYTAFLTVPPNLLIAQGVRQINHYYDPGDSTTQKTVQPHQSTSQNSKGGQNGGPHEPNTPSHPFEPKNLLKACAANCYLNSYEEYAFYTQGMMSEHQQNQEQHLEGETSSTPSATLNNFSILLPNYLSTPHPVFTPLPAPTSHPLITNSTDFQLFLILTFILGGPGFSTFLHHFHALNTSTHTLTPHQLQLIEEFALKLSVLSAVFPTSMCFLRISSMMHRFYIFRLTITANVPSTSIPQLLDDLHNAQPSTSTTPTSTFPIRLADLPPPLPLSHFYPTISPYHALITLFDPQFHLYLATSHYSIHHPFLSLATPSPLNCTIPEIITLFATLTQSLHNDAFLTALLHSHIHTSLLNNTSCALYRGSATEYSASGYAPKHHLGTTESSFAPGGLIELLYTLQYRPFRFTQTGGNQQGDPINNNNRPHYMTQLNVWTDATMTNTLLEHLITHSYNVYQGNRPTLYQLIASTVRNVTLPCYLGLMSILLGPFKLNLSQTLLHKHITLCVHAGLLNPSTIHAPLAALPPNRFSRGTQPQPHLHPETRRPFAKLYFVPKMHAPESNFNSNHPTDAARDVAQRRNLANYIGRRDDDWDDFWDVDLDEGEDDDDHDDDYDDNNEDDGDHDHGQYGQHADCQGDEHTAALPQTEPRYLKSALRTISRVLIPFRALVYTYLMTLTGFEAVFPMIPRGLGLNNLLAHVLGLNSLRYYCPDAHCQDPTVIQREHLFSIKTVSGSGAKWAKPPALTLLPNPIHDPTTYPILTDLAYLRYDTEGNFRYVRRKDHAEIVRYYSGDNSSFSFQQLLARRTPFFEQIQLNDPFTYLPLDDLVEADHNVWNDKTKRMLQDAGELSRHAYDFDAYRSSVNDWLNNLYFAYFDQSGIQEDDLLKQLTDDVLFEWAETGEPVMLRLQNDVDEDDYEFDEFENDQLDYYTPLRKVHYERRSVYHPDPKSMLGSLFSAENVAQLKVSMADRQISQLEKQYKLYLSQLHDKETQLIHVMFETILGKISAMQVQRDQLEGAEPSDQDAHGAALACSLFSSSPPVWHPLVQDVTQDPLPLPPFSSYPFPPLVPPLPKAQNSPAKRSETDQVAMNDDNGGVKGGTTGEDNDDDDDDCDDAAGDDAQSPPSPETMEYRQNVSSWALEMLLVASLNVQPLLRFPSKPTAAAEAGLATPFTTSCCNVHTYPHAQSGQPWNPQSHQPPASTSLITQLQNFQTRWLPSLMTVSPLSTEEVLDLQKRWQTWFMYDSFLAHILQVSILAQSALATLSLPPPPTNTSAETSQSTPY